jgi:hypothetical protein
VTVDDDIDEVRETMTDTLEILAECQWPFDTELYERLKRAMEDILTEMDSESNRRRQRPGGGIVTLMTSDTTS